MTITLDKNPIKSLNEAPKEKCCSFPGCNQKFLGKGKVKYCDEHRKPIYHKQLYFDKYKLQKLPDTVNQIIVHNDITMKKILRCQHPECYKTFEIVLRWGSNVYPKFCSQHRSEFQRSMR